MSVESFRGPGDANLVYQYDNFTDPWKDAPTAVLAHGFPANSNIWYAWVPPLSRHLRVVRNDLRGLGLSKVPVETFRNSLDSLVLDAIALLDHLELEKAIWIGEASGGIVGLALALSHPQRLHALVVINASLKPGDWSWDEKDLRPGESLVGQKGIDFMLTKGIREWSAAYLNTRPFTKDAPPGYVDWYTDQICQNDTRLAAEFYRGMQKVDLLPVIRDLGVPALYLEGDRDSMFKAEHREIMEHVANVRVVTIEGPGIDLGYARPDACATQVKGFLRELGLLPA